MGYAYFQGQEEQALDYYKKLLAITSDAEQRKTIEHVIKELEEFVADRKCQTPAQGHVSAGAVHNAFFAAVS